MIYDVHGDPLGTASGNVLYGKKYVACGDSFTAGDATGYTDAAGNTGTNSDFYDQKLKAWKTYPWWIAKRNDMTLVNEAVSALCSPISPGGFRRSRWSGTRPYRRMQTTSP